MQITWFGHSCFRLDTGKSSLLIDPFFNGNSTFEDSGVTVRQATEGVAHVALTHGHFETILATRSRSARRPMRR